MQTKFYEATIRSVTSENSFEEGEIKIISDNITTLKDKTLEGLINVLESFVGTKSCWDFEMAHDEFKEWGTSFISNLIRNEKEILASEEEMKQYEEGKINLFHTTYEVVVSRVAYDFIPNLENMILGGRV